MPNLDRTGPNGDGARTGKKRGLCGRIRDFINIENDNEPGDFSTSGNRRDQKMRKRTRKQGFGCKAGGGHGRGLNRW